MNAEPAADFSASAMLRVIARGLARLGLAGPALSAGASTHSMRPAQVPLDHKRALLQALAQQHGAGLLLQLGQGVHDAPMEPALQALLLATTPAELVRRWQRLERFVHTRHRVAVVEAGAQRLLLRHHALRGEPPTAEEDALVWGVLVGLLQRMGQRSLKARFAGERRWRVRPEHEGQGIDPRRLPRTTDRWELQWSAPRHAESPPQPADTIVEQVRQCIEADLSRAWTVAGMAQALHRAPRSLQRELATGQTSFALLLQSTRVAAASQALTRGGQGLAEIGYVCGFADQAHFTREFKRHVGLTPLKYREQFGV
jgi:AraC-like DNA-binding protein